MAQTIRKVAEKERRLIPEIYANAYRVDPPEAERWARGTALGDTRAIFEAGRIVSILQIHPYKIYVGGNQVTMGGIGGVATRADRQGKGFAGSLMTDSLFQMRERGFWTSILYPFSYAFYRKFGWELCGLNYSYGEIRRDQILPAREKDLVHSTQAGREIGLLDPVYREFAVRHNLCVVRNGRMWKNRLSSIRRERGEVYVIRSGKKTTGYFFCIHKPLDFGYEASIREFACLDEEAYKAFFGFLAQLPVQVARISIFAPSSPLLWKYLKEPYAARTLVAPLLQFRVVDVRKAVEARGFPRDVSGRAVLAIRDETADWNAGPWELEIGDGKARMKKTTLTPDFTCSIQAFSELYSGHAAADQLAADGKLKVRLQPRIPFLKNAFFGLTPHILTWF